MCILLAELVIMDLYISSSYPLVNKKKFSNIQLYQTNYSMGLMQSISGYDTLKANEY